MSKIVNISPTSMPPVSRSPQEKRSLANQLSEIRSKLADRMKLQPLITRETDNLNRLSVQLNDIKTGTVFLHASPRGMHIDERACRLSRFLGVDGGFNEAEKKFKALSIRLSDETINPLKNIVPAGPKQKVLKDTLKESLTSSIIALGSRATSVEGEIQALKKQKVELEKHIRESDQPTRINRLHDED